jgi:hypothetical protein
MSKNRTDTSTETGQVSTQSGDAIAQQPADQQTQQAPSGATLDPMAGDESVSQPIIINR